MVKGIWNAREELDFGRMLDYAPKICNSAAVKRLGYLLGILEIDKKISINNLRAMIKKGFSSLDPLLPKKGEYNSQWNLLLNVSQEELLSFRRV